MESQENDLSYKIYISDCIKGIYTMLGGSAEKRYYDVIETKHITETRTPEEIINGIRNKLTNGGNEYVGNIT